MNGEMLCEVCHKPCGVKSNGMHPRCRMGFQLGQIVANNQTNEILKEAGIVPIDELALNLKIIELRKH